MNNLLLQQYKTYPKMQIQDMTKLIYQNEFAGGHLIPNEAESLHRLEQECGSLSRPAKDKNLPLFEKIGNGLCRLNLASLIDSEISMHTVNRLFGCTANQTAGSIQCFESKLDIFRKCCRDMELPYSAEDVEAYLGDYKKQGYPPVSHSEIYKIHYQPAYRIVKSEYLDYFNVFCKIDLLLKKKDRINVAIDGNSGAGKSTLAASLGRLYDGNVFHMDDFFLRPEQKTESRLKEVGGNIDYVRFKDEVLAALKRRVDFQYQVYSCKEMTLGKFVSVVPNRINIIEGSYSMHPTLVDNYDLRIFLHIDEKDQKQRILQRNGSVLLKRFLNEWIPKENQYFKIMKIEEQSDLLYKISN